MQDITLFGPMECSIKLHSVKLTWSIIYIGGGGEGVGITCYNFQKLLYFFL